MTRTPAAPQIAGPDTAPPVDHPDDLVKAAVALAQSGKPGEALPLLERAVQLDPGHAKARLNLGVALSRSGRSDEALVHLREAIRIRPDYAEAHFNLGTVLKDTGRGADSIVHFEEAIRLKPDHFGALNNLGLALFDGGRAAEAVILFRQAIRLNPAAADAHNNLGMALAGVGQFARAEEAYEAALRLDPRFSFAHCNLAAALKEQGQFEESLAQYDMAIRLNPTSATTRYNRSLVLLQAGDYARGWVEYEWRWRRAKAPKRSFPQPRWDGTPLDGKTILLWYEQGLGDTIQFVRFAPLVKARGATVVLDCQPSLKPLLSTCPGIDVVVTRGDRVPSYDVQIPLMSLPAVLGTTLQTMPAEIPYLFADSQRVEAWGHRLGDRSGGELRVGVVWQGSQHFQWDRFRSVPLVAFAPLAEVPGVKFFSLQAGPGMDQLATTPPQFRVQELNLDPDPASGAFLDTAAVMRHLDLVITVDTAAGHLAGALGVPVWLALSTVADWRWLTGREDTRWYPSMRLFRQQSLGNWSEVFSRMAVELAKWASGRRGGVSIAVEISPGELLDKITILDLKLARLSDPAKLGHVRTERAALEEVRERAIRNVPGLSDLVRDLAAVNEVLWDVEEHLRGCERIGDFSPAFVESARSVYKNNDRRAELKRRINDLLGSRFIEEKSYPLGGQVGDPDTDLGGIGGIPLG